MGWKPGDPRIATAVLNDTERMWRDAKGDYISDALNDVMAEGDEDVINLGYVG